VKGKLLYLSQAQVNDCGVDILDDFGLNRFSQKKSARQE
jgi:hypothetical protein